MRLSNKTVKVLASTVYYQGGEVTIIRRGQKSTRIQKPDGSQRVVYNSELADLPQKPGSYFDDSESDDLKDEIPKENRQHTPNSQVQKSGPDPKANAYYPVPLTQALQIIKDKGFRQRSQPRTFTSATLTTWENPVTQQLAQVKHEFKDKKGRPVDNASIVYLIPKGQGPKRRTPEQKARDNFVLYD